MPLTASSVSRTKRLTLLSIILLMFSLALSLLLNNVAGQALSGSQFQAGNIIEDAVFYNTASMTPQEIQNFLNSKVPSCDTSGEEMYNSTQTRAQWAAANGRPTPPYVCLKDYTHVTLIRDSRAVHNRLDVRHGAEFRHA